MNIIRSPHARTLIELIANRRREILESLAFGLPQMEYMRLCGHLQGLDEALKLSDDADNGDRIHASA